MLSFRSIFDKNVEDRFRPLTTVKNIRIKNRAFTDQRHHQGVKHMELINKLM